MKKLKKESVLTKESVKQEILEKFDTVSHFARLAGIDRMDLQKFFYKAAPTQEELAELQQKVRETEFQTPTDHIPEEKLEALREAITKSGSIRGFCIQNPEFPESSVKSILYGKRTKMSEGVRKLLAHFNIG